MEEIIADGNRSEERELDDVEEWIAWKAQTEGWLETCAGLHRLWSFVAWHAELIQVAGQLTWYRDGSLITSFYNIVE